MRAEPAARLTKRSSTGLYHGTRVGVRPGGLLLPGDELGKDNHALGRGGAVYVTPNLCLAWHYAEASKGRGTPKVCEVSPLGPLSIDDSTIGGEEQEAYATEAAVVVRVLRR